MTMRKDRGPEAQVRAEALSAQLKVSMRTAWKYYDEANTDRIAAEDEAFELVTGMRAEGHDDAHIAAVFGVAPEALTAFMVEMAPKMVAQPADR